MSDLRHILGRAARRDLAQRMVRRAGTGLVAGLAAGCVLLLADRAGLLAVPGGLYVLIAALGAMAGIIAATLTRRDRLALALKLDRTFRLKDRLATAESLQEGGPRRQDAAFSALVRRDADRLAGSLDVRTALPVRITGIWGSVTALALLLWLGVLYLPAISPARGADTNAIARRDESLRQERAEVANSIRDAVEDLEDDSQLDGTAPEELGALEQLASQLTGEGGEEFDPSAARDESAARLNELADRLAEQAQENAAAAEELSKRFAGLEAPDAPLSAEEFTEALRRGDFGEAADLLDELARDAKSMPDEERRAVADHLKALSREIQQADGAADRAENESRRRLEQALGDQGLDEREIQDLLDSAQPTADAVERELENRSVDEEISRELARDIQKLSDRQKADEQAARDARDVAEAVEQAAESIEPAADAQEAPPSSDDQTGRPPSEGGEKPSEGDRSAPGGEEQPVPGTPQDRPPAADGAEEQGREIQTARDQTEGPGQSQQRPAEPPPATGEQEQAAPRPTEGQPDPRQGAEQGSPMPEPGEQPGFQQPKQPQTPEEGQPAPRPGEEPAEPQADGQSGQDQAEPSPGEAIRQIERRRGMAERQHEAAERARQAASEMAENMTDEERRRWAEQWQREFGTSGAGKGGLISPDRADAPSYAPEQMDELNLSDDELAGRLIAEWLGDERIDRATGATEAGPASQRLGRARRDAERAVEESAVPSRYHRLIQRYFGRLGETIDKAAANSAEREPAPAKPDSPSAGDTDS